MTKPIMAAEFWTDSQDWIDYPHELKHQMVLEIGASFFVTDVLEDGIHHWIVSRDKEHGIDVEDLIATLEHVDDNGEFTFGFRPFETEEKK